jgi:hypothetical protein
MHFAEHLIHRALLTLSPARCYHEISAAGSHLGIVVPVV